MNLLSPLRAADVRSALAAAFSLALVAGCVSEPADSVGAADDTAEASLAGSEANYKDPGTGPWQKVSPELCGLDMSKVDDSEIANYAVFRFGKLCHMKGADKTGQMYSATKTLGGVMIGRAAYLTRNVPRTGPGTGTIYPEDKAVDWLGKVSYNKSALLTHVMSMCAQSDDLAFPNKKFVYDTFGATQINTLIDVTKKAIAQVPGLGNRADDFMRAQVFAKLGMTKSSWTPVPLGIAAGWSANMSDMGRLGMLLLHDGWYNGERLVSRAWMYRMSHPAFEDANTAYGHLTWLNHRGGNNGTGGNGVAVGGPDPKYAEGDQCAPAAFWPVSAYQQGPREAPNCGAINASCVQENDVGVFSAQGLFGQYIVMHPGLDLVIVARDYNAANGTPKLWEALRPGLVALDPVFRGDEAAFCAAYKTGSYAPNLVMPRHP
jgi:hypothetical protein